MTLSPKWIFVVASAFKGLAATPVQDGYTTERAAPVAFNRETMLDNQVVVVIPKVIVVGEEAPGLLQKQKI